MICFPLLLLFGADPDRIGLLGKPPAVEHFVPLQEPVGVLASYVQADGKILAAAENQADGKILAAAENQADGKILAGVEISAPSEILAELEMQAARLLFRLGEISNC
jgi:hypothetical protein